MNTPIANLLKHRQQRYVLAREIQDKLTELHSLEVQEGAEYRVHLLTVAGSTIKDYLSDLSEAILHKD